MSNALQIPGDFQTAWKRVAQRWHDTEQVWNDQIRKRFEKEFWTVLEQESSQTHASMESLTKIMAEAQRRVR